MSSTNPRTRAASLFIVALLVAPRAVRALEPPVTVGVASTHSGDGSFTFAITGLDQARCSELSQKVRLDHGPALTISSFGTCAFGASPASMAAPGTYCLVLDGLTGTWGTRCFDVTGSPSTTNGVRPTLTNVGPDSLSPSACVPCLDDPTQRACAQQQRTLRVRLTLADAGAELAADHAFAALPASAGAVPARDAKDWFVLSDDLSQSVLLPLEDGAAKACLTVYAATFTSSTPVELGRPCLDFDPPSALPNTTFEPSAACEPGYFARWCSLNRAACTGGFTRASSACAEYPKRCTASDGGSPDTALDGGSLDAASDGEAAGSMAQPGDAAAGSDAMPSASAKRAPGGCQLRPITNAPPVSLALVLALACALRRRRSQARSVPSAQ